MDKNKAMIDFLKTNSSIASNPFFYNFGSVQDNAHQASTSSDDIALQKPFVDGSVAKRYTFHVDSFKSVAYNPLAVSYPTPGEGETVSDESVDDFYSVQQLLEWVDAQNDARNFPDFGSNCIIEEMKPLTDRPKLIEVDTSLNPPIAVYRISIQIDYIDKSKQIWT